MVDKIQNTPPSPGPQGPAPSGPTPPASSFPSTSGGNPLNAWSQMFGGLASDKELKQIVALVLKGIADQIKKEQDKARETIRKMRQDQQDNS